MRVYLVEMLPVKNGCPDKTTSVILSEICLTNLWRFSNLSLAIKKTSGVFSMRWHRNLLLVLELVLRLNAQFLPFYYRFKWF